MEAEDKLQKYPASPVRHFIKRTTFFKKCRPTMREVFYEAETEMLRFAMNEVKKKYKVKCYSSKHRGEMAY